MLPSLGAVIATHVFLARRYGVSTPRDDARIAEAIEEAHALVGGLEHDEPAAILFTLMSRSRALGDLCVRLPLVLATNCARARGWILRCHPDEIEVQDLYLRIANRTHPASFAEVRAWVAVRCIRAIP